ncbi:MAG: tetraacyldisaccharide 4'-kinase [Prolixibacteraceae bacterium]|nr:tetraacyldisaccharide 4'-kinase [Prolixibacteraceae bacterium]MBN2650418.1 tetraacyldisaccharide 4'-kinase [Prolixibacteraceae bacterium]
MLKIILYPLSLLYRLVVAVRNSMFDTKILKQYEFDIPVISVGNITVGGTGKTPHAEYLISLLEKNFNVAFLSRGYKRKTSGYVLADKNSTVWQIGDEPVQIKQKFPHISVAVCEKRAVGIQKLLSDSSLNIDVIILDDAFQHRRVKPSINILLIDYTQPPNGDLLLPAGRLREPVNARYRANFIIYTKCPSFLQPIEQRIIKKKLNIRPYQNLFFTSIVYGEITPAQKGLALFNNDMRKYSVLLITGIGNPTPLLSYLEPQVGEIKHLEYSDHYHYTASDLDFFKQTYQELGNPEKIIITTEKDLVRIKSVDNPDPDLIRQLYYIPIEIRFLDRTKESFNKRIINYVTENKSNSKLYKR